MAEHTEHPLVWLIGGSAAAATAYYLFRRHSGHESAGTSHSAAPPITSIAGSAPTQLPGSWMWPLARWNGRLPVISDGFTSTRRGANGATIPHGGVDVMYARASGDVYPVGSPNGSRAFIMPDNRPALAASDGVVWFAAQTPRGWCVVIDHAPRGYASLYTHLSSLLVTAKQVVKAGEPIGIVGADPLDAQGLKHLHFELWCGGAKGRFDPSVLMRGWPIPPDPVSLVARNGRKRGPREALVHVGRYAVEGYDRRWPGEAT